MAMVEVVAAMVITMDAELEDVAVACSLVWIMIS